MNPILAAALAYAALGYRVLPTLGKKPSASTWRTDGTTDETLIRGLWEQTPSANVAIVTDDSFFVLDVDPYHGGDESLAALIEAYGSLPLTVMARTGAGRHYYFGGSAKCSAGLIAPGIDIRGDGGYAVAPPSLHANGNTYQWAQSLLETRGELADAPEWLVTLAQCESEYHEAGPAAPTDLDLEGSAF